MARRQFYATNTAWMARPVTARQLSWIESLVTERVLSDVDEDVLDIVADIESGVEVTGGAASRVIDALRDAPRKPIVYTALADPRPARLVALAEVEVALASASAEHAHRMVASEGRIGAAGRCIKCGHEPHAEACTAESTAWRPTGPFDDDRWLACGCTSTAVGDALSEAAAESERKVANARQKVAEAREIASRIDKGVRVVVARGRKVKRGSTGQVLTLRDGAYGPSAYLLLDDGSKVWTNLGNLDPEPV